MKIKVSLGFVSFEQELNLARLKSYGRVLVARYRLGERCNEVNTPLWALAALCIFFFWQADFFGGTAVGALPEFYAAAKSGPWGFKACLALILLAGFIAMTGVYGYLGYFFTRIIVDRSLGKARSL